MQRDAPNVLIAELIHCGTVGLANLEKRHHGTKTCLETKPKWDKNAKTTRNGSLLTFSNWSKPNLVPSTTSTAHPIQSQALPRETASSTKPAALMPEDRQAQPNGFVRQVMRLGNGTGGDTWETGTAPWLVMTWSSIFLITIVDDDGENPLVISGLRKQSDLPFWLRLFTFICIKVESYWDWSWSERCRAVWIV